MDHSQGQRAFVRSFDGSGASQLPAAPCRHNVGYGLVRVLQAYLPLQRGYETLRTLWCCVMRRCWLGWVHRCTSAPGAGACLPAAAHRAVLRATAAQGQCHRAGHASVCVCEQSKRGCRCEAVAPETGLPTASRSAAAACTGRRTKLTCRLTPARPHVCQLPGVLSWSQLCFLHSTSPTTLK